MSQPIDVAYVELRASGTDETARDVRTSLREIERDVRRTGDSMERSLSDSFDDIQDEFRQMLRALSRDSGNTHRTALTSVTTGITRDLAGGASTIQTTFTDMVEEIVDALSEVGDAVEDLGGGVEDTVSDVLEQAQGLASGALERLTSVAGTLRDTLVDTAERMRDNLDDVRDAMDDLADEVERDGERMEDSLDDVEDELSDGVAAAARRAAEAIENFVDDAEVDLEELEHAIAEVERELRNIRDVDIDVDVDRGLPRPGGPGGSGGGSPLDALGGLTGGPFGMLAKLTGLIAMLPIVQALVGSLLDLVGVVALLPAGIATLAAIVAPLIMSFQGLGDAVKALASGDLEAINEAMKNLAPSARTFARELHALGKPLHDLRLQVQDAFFKPLQGVLTQLVKTLLPSLRSGLTGVAGSLGKFLAGLGKAFSTPEMAKTIGAVFDTAKRVVDEIGPPLTKLFVTLTNVVKAGLPFIERIASALGEGMSRFADFLEGAIADGSFNEFVENALTAIKDFGALLFSVGRLFVAVFGDAGDEGHTFLQTLTLMVNKFADFLESDQGRMFVDGMEAAVDAFIIFTGAVILSITAFGTFINLLKGAWDIITQVASAVGDFFSVLGSGIASISVSVFDAVIGFFRDVGGWIAGAWESVVGFFEGLARWFSELPGRISTAIQELPQRVADVFTATFDRVTYLIGFGIGLIIRFFIELPGRISEAISTVAGVVTAMFTRTRDSSIAITTGLINKVVEFFAGLPNRVIVVLHRIIGWVSGVFNSVRNAVVSTVSNTYNRVLQFFQALPGRVVSFISGLPGRVLGVLRSMANGAYSIGKSIISGIMNGINAAVQGAINAAARAARNILQGAKDALGIGSPSRVFANEVGRQIPAGIKVGVQAETPELSRFINEVTGRIIPGALPGMTLAADQAGGGGDGQVVLSPGAVQVIFEGVVPTREEAYRAGEAAGRGISQTLARRDVRTKVRTR